MRGTADRSFRVHLPELDLHAGRFCGLVGQSGSGKSTLLDMLGLVLKPSRVGRMNLLLPRHDGSASTVGDLKACWDQEDEEALSSARRMGMGYVLQTGGLFPFLSAGDNITLPARMTGLAVSRQAVEQRLGQLGLNWGYDKKVSELSGGERQRVAILRALIHNPSIVLADEPTAAVDRDRAISIVSSLKQYATKSGAAVIMVTHDVALLDGMADLVLQLKSEPGRPPEQVSFRAVQVAG